MTLHHHLFARAASRQCTLIRLPAHDAHDRRGEDAIDTAVHSVLADPALRVAGVCRDLGTLTDPTAVGARVEDTIARMDDIHRAYAIIPTTLVLESEYDPTSGVDVPQHRRQLLEAIEEGLGTACEKYRFPRPSLTLMLRTTAPATHATLAMVGPGGDPRTTHTRASVKPSACVDMNTGGHCHVDWEADADAGRGRWGGS